MRRITSYPVGRTRRPNPYSAWLWGEAAMNGTHLSRRRVRPGKGTVTIHPARSYPRPAVLEVWSWLCLEHGIGGHEAGGEKAPERDDQLARECHDGDAAHAAALVADAGLKPATEGALGLMHEP